MKKEICVALATLLMSAPAIADESYASFNLGPTFFTFRGEEPAINGAVSESGVFCGAKGEAAYTIHGLVYGSVMGVYAPGANTSTQNIVGFTKDGNPMTMKVGTRFWQAEAKIGKHQPLMEKFSVVPFLALGVYSIHSSINLSEIDPVASTSTQTVDATSDMRWTYAAGGIMGNYFLGSNFEIGFSAKLMRHLSIKNDKTYNELTNSQAVSNGWGYEVSLPMKAITTNKSWCVALDPFFLKLDTSKATNVFGARVSLQKGF